MFLSGHSAIGTACVFCNVSKSAYASSKRSEPFHLQAADSREYFLQKHANSIPVRYYQRNDICIPFIKKYRH